MPIELCQSRPPLAVRQFCMSAHKLILHPVVADAAPASEPGLISALGEIGLLGTPFELDGRSHFQTGPAFLDHISFLGCSPSIELEPPAHALEAAARCGGFCHLSLQSTTAAPQLRLRNGHGPRCRKCRADIDPALIPLQHGSMTCPQCGRVTTTAHLNWRQAGAYARIFLEIWGIHAHEAVPSDGLLDHLATITGFDWGFFYIED